MRRLVQHLGNLLLILSIGLAILLLIPLIPVSDQWYQLAVVRSASMEPKLKVGSLAIYKAQAAYYPGEVIAYQTQENKSEKLIIHRIVEKNDQPQSTVYLTQGDATQYISSEPILKNQVKGKLIGSIPQAGYLISWFKSQVGISVVVLFLLMILVMEELFKWPLN